MKTLFSIALLLFSVSAYALVEPGQNILLNPGFEVEQNDFPPYWTVTLDKYVFFEEGAGPESSGVVILRSRGSEQFEESTVRQLGHVLVPGETYRLGAWIKTKDFQSTHYGVIVRDTNWRNVERGINELPENTNGWQYFEKDINLAESPDGKYGVTIFAINFSGELHVALPKLQAISPKALAESIVSPELRKSERFRLVPWRPRLNHIPSSRPELSLRNFGMGKTEICRQHDCIINLDARQIQNKPLQVEENMVDLSGVSLGDHEMEVIVRRRHDKELVFTQIFPITIREIPAIDTGGYKRLNNLVIELLNEELNGTEQSLHFDNPREGWIYMTLQNCANRENLNVELAELGTVIDADSKRLEAFRHLGMGRHVIRLKGVRPACKIIVRAISETFNYPACQDSPVPQHGKYDWDFFEKYVFPAVTTLNKGDIPEDKLPEFKARGLRWLANRGTLNPVSAEDLMARFDRSPGLKLEKYDGITCDEQFFLRNDLIYYTEAMWKYEVPKDRLIYTWVNGKPLVPGLHHEFLSACVNVSRERGRLLFEAYNHAKASEAEAQRYLNSKVLGSMERFSQYFPDATAYTGIILGNFNLISNLTLNTDPEVDPKYYLDMQMNLLANNPAFKDLATVGYWGSSYNDEELFRWSMQLL